MLVVLVKYWYIIWNFKLLVFKFLFDISIGIKDKFGIILSKFKKGKRGIIIINKGKMVK